MADVLEHQAVGQRRGLLASILLNANRNRSSRSHQAKEASSPHLADTIDLIMDLMEHGARPLGGSWEASRHLYPPPAASILRPWRQVRETSLNPSQWLQSSAIVPSHRCSSPGFRASWAVSVSSLTTTDGQIMQIVPAIPAWRARGSIAGSTAPIG